MSTEAQQPLLLRVESRHGDDIHALRAILQGLLRQFGWRCVNIVRETHL
jgi:hypothetical protein